MHSLTGFIQVLLMLTHSEFVPDVSWIWRSEPSVGKVVSPPTIRSGLQKSNTGTWHFHTEATDANDKEKIPVKTNNAEADKYPTQPQQKWPERKRVSNRLYLVFCQLKTEG